MSRKIYFTDSFPDGWVHDQLGKFLTDSHYDQVIGGEDVDVYKPDYSPLCLLRTAVLPWDVCELAYGPLRRAARAGRNNRKEAGGGSYRKRRSDGTLINWEYAFPAESNIIGFFPRKYGVAGPSAGMTSWTRNHLADYDKIVPFARAVNQVFKETMPDRYEAQLEMVKKTDPRFVISGTVFTTITVNRNWPIAVHIDKGDLKEGFGVLSLLRGGDFTGGHYCYPKYDLAVDLKTTDVLLGDVHEPHGVTPIHGDRFDRIMCIFYFATKMADVCPSSFGLGKRLVGFVLG